MHDLLHRLCVEHDAADTVSGHAIARGCECTGSAARRPYPEHAVGVAVVRRRQLDVALQVRTPLSQRVAATQPTSATTAPDAARNGAFSMNCARRYGLRTCLRRAASSRSRSRTSVIAPMPWRTIDQPRGDGLRQRNGDIPYAPDPYDPALGPSAPPVRRLRAPARLYSRLLWGADTRQRTASNRDCLGSGSVSAPTSNSMRLAD